MGHRIMGQWVEYVTFLLGHLDSHVHPWSKQVKFLWLKRALPTKLRTALLREI